MAKNTKKINLAIIFGGRSAEHEVSINSARNIVAAINKSKYEIILIGIDRKGNWYQFKKEELLSGKFSSVDGNFGMPACPFTEDGEFFVAFVKSKKKIDVVFPILHGPFGEDGTMQGLLKLSNVPFVGPGVLGSAIGMDKDVSKRLLKEAGIPVSKFVVFGSSQKKEVYFNKIKKELGLPVFVKPANLGSSVGISKANNEKEFDKAIKLAFRYDKKIIIEEAVVGKEIECAVLGNEKPSASIPGEIVPSRDFYSYEAKYIDADGAVMRIPADISKTVADKIQKMAVAVFETLCAEGMGRVDFFLTAKNEIFVNEINTIPGFTSISMYPKLWEHSGIKYADLIDKLIGFAISRYKEESKLKSVF